MLEQIKELCLFMICGQTLLYFQSGKKYEKICRMILELLVLAGIVGMVLELLQSFGLQRGEMEATGGAVAGMQQSMEEALSRQLGAEEFLSEDVLTGMIERHTENEIKSRYNYFANQYGLEIDRVEQRGDKLQVFLKATEEKTQSKEESSAENPAKIDEIKPVEIGEIDLGDGPEEDPAGEERAGRGRIGEEELETFRRQLALVFAMEEEKLEVILID